jgi:hypothetical protein
MIGARRIGVFLSVTAVLAVSPRQFPAAPILPAVDYRAVVAKADLVYDAPVAINRDTDSFFERNTDYMGGCGFVDIERGRALVLPGAMLRDIWSDRP